MTAFYECVPIKIEIIKIINANFGSNAMKDGVLAVDLFRENNPVFMDLSWRRKKHRLFPIPSLLPGNLLYR